MRELHFFIQNLESGDYRVANPIFADGFNIVTERESGQIFFRDKLSDALTFVAEDYDFIMSQPFDSTIDISISILDDGNLTMQWNGSFARTDCIINEVDGTIKVTPEVQDQYTKIIKCLDKEFNVAGLPLAQEDVKINVPPVLQIYFAGRSYVSNYWQGEVWEKDVEPITDAGTLNGMGFYLRAAFLTASGLYGYARILHSSTGSGDVNDDFNISKIYKYYYYPALEDDIGIKLVFSSAVSATPTEWGQKYINGQSVGYYVQPADSSHVYVPFKGEPWGVWSYWLEIDKTKTTAIDDATQTRFLYAAYPLASILRGLLSANSLSLNFAANSTYSQFFYGATTPITGWVSGWDLLFTAKSNIINFASSDTEFATKVPCTLATVLNFLKTAMNVWWSVEGGRLILEHISYYKNGGSYNGSPTVQYDLTTMHNPRNDKPWAWGQNQYQFETNTIHEYVKWTWMDETDKFFDGSGFECVSKYVQNGLSEEKTIANISTNIVKMMLNPDIFSIDGLAVIFRPANGQTDYTQFTREIGGTWRVVNGELAMWTLQASLLLYDAPCDKINVSGSLHTGVDYKRTKYNEVTFPALTVNPFEHIKTNVGDGEPDVITNDLTSNSVKVKLKYDNE